MTDNTVGSLGGLQTLVSNNESAYIFGLWCADGYHWSSSIGLSNSDKKLIDRFSRFLASIFPKDRLRLRVYYPKGQKPFGFKIAYPMRLAKQISYHTYVNSRPLVRLFFKTKENLPELKQKYLAAYFAGRFDGDGTIAKDLRSDLRISYTRKAEAELDQWLLNKLSPLRTKVYHYRTSSTYVLYISRMDASVFLKQIRPFSTRLQHS